MPLFEVTNSKLSKTLLNERFIVNPFSVIDAKSGAWRKGRQFWYDLLDTNNDIRHTVQTYNNTPGSRKNTAEYATDKFYSNIGTSLFDPFLCEILYKWFSNDNDKVIDPFAGGHSRGMVASVLGRDYIGYDINPKQVEFNNSMRDDIYSRVDVEGKGAVSWIAADGNDIKQLGEFDFMLTCPPYYNLERYTNDPNDISNAESYESFKESYANILNNCYKALKDNTFAVIVVGEIRDPNGIYYGFVPDTINIMKECGWKYYNEIILENTIGSLPIRCPRHFDNSRKVGKQHQNVLVFYKGDPQEISKKFKKFENKC